MMDTTDFSADGRTVMVRVPLAIRRRGGRKLVLAPDGSNLTAHGLPTPNLFAGMHEVHSEREWVSVQDMAKAAEVLIELARVWEERA